MFVASPELISALTSSLGDDDWTVASATCFAQQGEAAGDPPVLPPALLTYTVSMYLQGAFETSVCFVAKVQEPSTFLSMTLCAGNVTYQADDADLWAAAFALAETFVTESHAALLAGLGGV